jgi:hypothetical protein
MPMFTGKSHKPPRSPFDRGQGRLLYTKETHETKNFVMLRGLVVKGLVETTHTTYIPAARFPHFRTVAFSAKGRMLSAGALLLQAAC